MKRSIKKTAAFTSALLMLFSAACSEKNTQTDNIAEISPVTQTMYKEERIVMPEDYSSLEAMKYINALDRYYLIYRNFTGNFRLCIMNQNFEIENTTDLCDSENITESIFNINQNGEIVQLYYFADYVQPDDSEYNPQDFIENADVSFYSSKYDNSGKIISEVRINGLEDYFDLEKSRFTGFVQTNENNYTVNFYTSLVSFDETGKILEYVHADSIDYIGTDSSGKVVTGSVNKLVYLEDGKLNESSETIVPTDYLRINSSPLSGTNGYKMYVRMNEGFFGITEDNELVKIMDYVSSGIIASEVYDIQPGPEGQLLMYCANKSGSQYVAKLTVRPDGYTENKQTLILGTEWTAADDVKQILTQFNKQSDDYIIETRSYEADPDSFTKDLLTDNAPDLYMYRQTAYMYKYANAEVFADMYGYMDKYGGLSKNEICDNVIEAFEYKDGLYGICSDYSIGGYIANSEVIGKEYTNWTYEDMYKLTENMPEDMYFGNNMDFNSRDSVFNSFGGFNTVWIDYENSACNFNSESFIKYLEFCRDLKLMPEYEWETLNDENVQKEQLLMLKNKKALIQGAYINHLSDIMNKADSIMLEPENWTFVGNPSDTNSGTINSSRIYSIVSESKVPEGAWSFINFIMSQEYQDNLAGSDGGVFLTRKDSFEKSIYRYQNMQEIDGLTRYYRPLTDAAYEVFIPYLESCSTLYYHNAYVTYIMDEEFLEFINSSISAEECAERIQNRVSIYLAESK